MATRIATRYALEIHELRGQVHVCRNSFNGDLASVIDELETTYLSELDVRNEIEKRLDARLALIEQLEVIYGDLGEDSEAPVAHAAHNRRVWQKAGDIARIHDEITKLVGEDEELKSLAASHVREKAVYNALDLANSLVDQVAFEMLKMLNLGHKEVSAETTTRGDQLITRLLILHKKLIAVHQKLGGFEDADPTSMSQRTDLKWQSACGGLWWCLDYLILRLAAIKKALMTTRGDTTRRTVNRDLLLSPIVDIHFFRQNIAALRAIHDYNQDFSALSRIASRFSPFEVEEGSLVAQEHTESDMMSVHSADFGPRERELALFHFRNVEEASVDKVGTTDASDLVKRRLELYRRGDAIQFRTTVSAIGMMRGIVDPKHKPTDLGSLALEDKSNDSKQGMQMFGQTDTKPDDVDNVDDSVPKVSVSAFHPGQLPNTWTLPPHSALSIDDSEGFPSPYQPIHVWAEKRERERQILLYGEPSVTSSGSDRDEENQHSKSKVVQDISCAVVEDGQELSLGSKPHSVSKDNTHIASEQVNVAFGEDSEGFVLRRYYRHSEFKTDNMSILTKQTNMTSASRIVNDLLSPVHSAVKLKLTKYLGKLLTLKVAISHINAKDGRGFTPLELAISTASDDPDIARALVTAGADITNPCLGYSNALLAIIRRQDFNLALFIVQEAPMQVSKIINDRDAEGLSPLLLVARFKADSHAPDGSLGDSPEFNQEALYLALIDCGADLKMYTNQEHLTAVHYAARHRILALVERLVDENVDVNAVDIRGWTPLHEAIMAGYVPDVVAALIVGGADPSIAGQSGVTPLRLALGWHKLAQEGRLSYNGDKVKIDKEDREVALREVNNLISMLESASTTSENDATAGDVATAEDKKTANDTPTEEGRTAAEDSVATKASVTVPT